MDIINGMDFRVLKEKAFIDALTSLYNRQFCVEYFKSLENKKTKYSLGIVDIDFFKKINDQYGHDAGDYILIHLSKMMKSKFSEHANTKVIRWGGEEFLIFLENCNLELAYKKLEEFRKSVENENIYFNGYILNITVTIGLSNNDIKENVHSTIKKSDLALLKGKNTGRNKVVL